MLYLGNSNVRWGGFDLSDLSLMKFEEGEYERYGIKVGDLIVCEGGEPGRCAIWNEELPDMKIQKALHRVRPKPTLNNYYLYYWFLYTGRQGLLEPYFTGTTIKHLTGKALNNLQIPLPPIEYQEYVAEILNSIDKKIEINRQINQTLEAMAQAIFKSWFIDFDPVRAKIAALEAGEDPTRAAMRAISGKTDAELEQMPPEQYAELKATAELFPSAMTESELGEVPEGWEVSEIGKEFDVTMGQSPPGDTYNEEGDGTPFFQGRRDFGWRYPSKRVYCTAPKRMANKGDTLLSVRAPVGDINKAVTECCVGRGLAAIRHKSGCEAYTYYSMWELGRHFVSFDSEGTVFGSINQKDLKAIKVIKSNEKVLTRFSTITGTIDEKIAAFESEIQTLSLLRDSLLPKLLSGEIGISEKEKLREAAI